MATMNFCYIVSCAFFIATVYAQSTPSASLIDYPYDYEDEPVKEADEITKSETLEPIVLVTKPQKVTVKEGQPAILECKAINAENVGFIWTRDKQLISNGPITLEPDLYDLQNNSLLIKHVKPASTGYYTCTIMVSQDRNITLTHRLMLENDAEILSLSVQNDITQLYPGDTLVLTCVVKGKPQPTIKWYFYDNEQSGSYEVQTNKQNASEASDTLVIENVNLKNSGTYRCVADNRRSTDYQSIVIEVFDKGRDVAASHTDSRTSRGLQLTPSLIIVLSIIALMEP